MKKISLIILAVLFCSSVFAKQKKHPKKRQAANDIVSVLIFRTGCFGKCPTYTVEINKDGMATYTAIRFNADSGTFQKNIGIAKAKEVLDEVSSYRPDTCKDDYDNRVPDLPGVNFTITYKNKAKTIRNGRWGPGFLQLLGTHIDAAGKKTEENNTGWQRVTAKKE